MIRAGQHPSDLRSPPLQLSPSDTLRSRFLDSPMQKSKSQGVFTRLIQDSKSRRKAKQTQPQTVVHTKKGKGTRIEDELLRKHREAQQEREVLKARWDKVVMREVLPAPQISPYSKALAEQAARYNSHLRCCLHQQLPTVVFQTEEVCVSTEEQVQVPTSPSSSPPAESDVPVSTPPPVAVPPPAQEEQVKVEDKGIQTVECKRPRPQVRPVGMTAVAATVSLERAREYRAMVERHMALVREV